MENSEMNKKNTKDNIIGIENIDEEIKNQIYELSKSLTSWIKKWEKLMYPMIIGFIILAIYGFYLIYNVTNDMSKMSKSVAEMNFTVSQMSASIFQMVTITGVQMDKIDTRMGDIHESMEGMGGNIEAMSGDISSMNTSLKQMNGTLEGMYQSVYYMGQTTGQMNSNFSELNENISRPLDSMNNVMPWSMFGSKKYSNNKNRRQPPMRPQSHSPYNQSPMLKEPIK